MRLRNSSGERRSSDRRNNSDSWISEIKEISNVTVRKKRGRRAPPSAKRTRGKKVDKASDSDDAVDNDMDDTDEGMAGTSQSTGHIEECADGRTGDPDLPKTGNSGNSSDGTSASEEQVLSANSKHMIQKASCQPREKVSERPTRSKRSKRHLNDLENEAGSHMEAAVVKKGPDEEMSQEIKNDDVSDAQVNSTSSEDQSSEEVEDVKVCDICGDVGEEDKLAVCSRCNDGAEHVYCMRVMLEEVPDSEWLCEDCQTAVEFERKKLDKCEVKVGTSKQQSSDAAKSSSSDSELEAENVVKKEPDTANEGSDMANNRMEGDSAITCTVRETISKPGGLYIGADSRKRTPLSRVSSSKSDADRGKQPSQVATSLASGGTKNQTPEPRGQLSKSTSFNNSKIPKVKQLLNEVPQKPKSLKESWTSAIKKEGTMSMTTKSPTFKKPKPCEPANKAKPSNLSTAEGPMMTNPLLSPNATNDGGTSILGCPSATASAAAPVLSKSDTSAQHLASGNNMSDSNNLSTAHGQGSKNSHGNSELKKPPLANVPGNTMIPNAERCSGILGPGAQRKVMQNSDPSHRDNKIKDPTGFRTGVSNSRTIRCQRCNEVGHSSQFCAVDKLRLSAIKPLSERNLKEASAKRNLTPGSSTLVTTEQATSRSADQSEQIVKFGDYQNPTVPSCRRDESCQSFSSGDEQITSTIPELDYIWQGGFELWRTGRSPELCDGFQAHLSCSASQSVQEVAKKFPSNVQLEELPRQNSWPTQFEKKCPTHENVGLFFFARDVQSYENHYSKLVENMLKNDLVLRGRVDTVELLIFPSNILSKNFQRWNMFYFLWGVFRVSREDCSNLPSDVPKCTRESNLNEDPRSMDPNAVLSSSHLITKDANNVAKPGPDLVKSATCADNQHQPSLEADRQQCLNGEKSLNQPGAGRPLDEHHDSFTARCSTNNNGATNHSTTATKINYLEHQDIMRNTMDGNVSGRDFDVNMVPDDCSVPLIHDEGKYTAPHEPGKESTTINLNDAEQLMDIDHTNTPEVNKGALGSASGGKRKRDFEMINGADEVDGALEHKKIKLDNIVPANSGLCDNIGDVKLSSKVHPLSVFPVDDGTDNKVMANSDGKCVFPLDLNAMDDTVSGDIANGPSSNALEQEMGVDSSSEKALSSISPKVGEKQNNGDSLPADITGSLSLSLGFLTRKEK
ncbi:hypothetical protein EJB05_01834 [Eragrostis curvula]|uniref:PHD-type domain-containing protein n=1 Tax=Eragrostis curvula TaxID=38414 RepID=A0A5J9WNY7_9POAL|nr:hypothetical protein EJB05_01834 [Eragrostis curvula]